MASDALTAGAIAVTSKTMPPEQIDKILSTPGIVFKDGHFEYPVSNKDQRGNHLSCLFLIEPIAANDQYVDWIVGDIVKWLESEQIEIDTVLAPAQPAVKILVNALAKRRNIEVAYWEYLPGGWFGTGIVEGGIKPGAKVLVFNGVSQQGRCVGARLPSFVESLGGHTVAAAVFAKGTAEGVKAAERRFGKKLYSTIEVSIPISSPDLCPICKTQPAKKLIPWTELKK